jgi:hypothetical protein
MAVMRLSEFGSVRMGNLGDKTEGEVLFADQGRVEAAPHRSCKLGKGDCPGGPVPRG